MDAAHTTQGSGSCMSCRRDGSHTGRMDTSWARPDSNWPHQRSLEGSSEAWVSSGRRRSRRSAGISASARHNSSTPTRNVMNEVWAKFSINSRPKIPPLPPLPILQVVLLSKVWIPKRPKIGKFERTLNPRPIPRTRGIRTIWYLPKTIGNLITLMHNSYVHANCI